MPEIDPVFPPPSTELFADVIPLPFTPIPIIYQYRIAYTVVINFLQEDSATEPRLRHTPPLCERRSGVSLFEFLVFNLNLAGSLMFRSFRIVARQLWKARIISASILNLSTLSGLSN
jgi:hypothetical protein